MNRNSCRYGNFILSPVEDFSIFTGFTCLHPEDTDRDLDEFIHIDAERHFKDKIAITYSLTTQDYPLTPIGFVTLQNDAILIPEGEILDEVANYHYHAFPAVKIGRLGIHIEMQNSRYGTLLLFLVKTLMCSENRTGCRFLTVDARRDKANKVNVVPFYEKNGFSMLTLRPKTSKTVPMFFDLVTFNKH